MTKEESPNGGTLNKESEQPVQQGCENWQKAFCIQTRAENEPETLVTDDPNTLMCPVCGIKINWSEQNV